MVFSNPLLLFGLAAISVPLIIHLLARRPTARTSWAAMRFIKTAVEASRGRGYGRNGILLGLRCAFLGLLALALARPAWRHDGYHEARGGSVAAILLLDQSASMAQTDGAVSRFAKAQQAAEQVLDSLPTGSAAAVWWVSDEVREIIPEPARDLSLSRLAIRAATRTDRGAGWQPAIQRALDVLAQEKAGEKQLYLFTDGQATNWKPFGEAAAIVAGAKDRVQMRVVIAGETERQNLAVTALRLTSPIASVSEPLRFAAEVSNSGVAEARNVAVSLAVDAEAPSAEQTLESIAPGVAKSVSLSVTLHEAGFHTVTARVAPDRAPADDSRTIALRAADKVNVLLVDGDPAAEPRDRGVFYLRNALSPVPPEQREEYRIQTKTASPAELEALKLADFDAVVLSDVAEVSDAVLAAFEKYLRAGGGLVVFPGANINAPFYNEEMHARRTFLPATFGEPRGSLEQDHLFFQWQSKGYSHPIVEPWNDATAGSLGSAHFFRALTLAPGQPSEARGDAGPPVLVLSYADGQPAVMERTWGRGCVVQFSSTAGPKWNDLSSRPAFVPLMHRVLGALLARQDEHLNGPCGAKFTLDVAADAAGRRARVVGPGAANSREPQREAGAGGPAQSPLISNARSPVAAAGVNPGSGGTDALSPGESLELFVREDASFNGKYEVRRGGYIILAQVGRIPVTGQTVEQAAVSVRRALESAQLAHATVTIERSAATGSVSGPVVYLSGEFKNPRPYRIPDGTIATLVGVILSSGGVNEKADLSQVRIKKAADGSVETVNVQRILDGRASRDPAAEPMVGAGDVITVPAGRANLIYVSGQGKRQGSFRLVPGERLSAYGAFLQAQAAGLLADGGGRAPLEYDDTALAGAYEVRYGDDAKPVLRFATQIDRAESPLAELSADDLKALSSSAEVIRWTEPAGFRALLERERTGVDFWLPLAILGLIVAVTETVLGNRWNCPS